MVAFIFGWPGPWWKPNVLAAQIVVQVLVIINGQDALSQTASFGRLLEGADTEAVAQHQLLVI